MTSKWRWKKVPPLYAWDGLSLTCTARPDRGTNVVIALQGARISRAGRRGPGRLRRGAAGAAAPGAAARARLRRAPHASAERPPAGRRIGQCRRPPRRASDPDHDAAEQPADGPPGAPGGGAV